MTTTDHADTSLQDLGRDRYDQDVAAVGDRDYAFFATRPVHVAEGRAPKGLEAQVFAWNAMHYTTEEKDRNTELKGDLHGGQLHRANRAAKLADQPMQMYMPGFDTTREKGKKKGKGPGAGGVNGKNVEEENYMTAARKPAGGDVWPLCKGIPQELDADLFWNEPLV